MLTDVWKSGLTSGVKPRNNSLSKIHASKIIHKDINPTNVIWNPRTAQLRIIDFGIATRLAKEKLVAPNINDQVS